MKHVALIALLVVACVPGSAATATGFGDRDGPYLGEEAPGRQPRIFAPGLVSTGLRERDLLVHQDGRTIWYGVTGSGVVSVLETRLEDGGWTDPVQVPFHVGTDFFCFEAALSADGSRVFYLTNQAAPGQEQGAGWANQNIFACRRTADGGWSEPAALPAPITTDQPEFFPSPVADGTFYFTRGDTAGGFALWSAEPAGESFAEPVRLPDTVNNAPQVYNAYAAPDESWICACVAGHPDNLGPTDYWLSFRDEAGQWLPAVNMGDPFNGPGLRAEAASLSPDGRYFFFASQRVPEGELWPEGRVTRARLLELQTGPGGGSSDIWWVEASVLEVLRPQSP